jgi:hypothetical protein
MIEIDEAKLALLRLQLNQVIDQPLEIAGVAEQEDGVETVLAMEVLENGGFLRRLCETREIWTGGSSIVFHQEIGPELEQPAASGFTIVVDRFCLQLLQPDARSDHEGVGRKQPWPQPILPTAPAEGDDQRDNKNAPENATGFGRETAHLNDLT